MRTALAQHVLDVFNESGVRIVTPACEGHPEAPKVVKCADGHLPPATPVPGTRAPPSARPRRRVRYHRAAGPPAMHDTPPVTPESIRASIAATIACDALEVRGDGHHFEALVVSSRFEGLARVRRHQLVYAALGDRMRQEIHALSMRTLTPGEWQAQGQQ